MTRAYNTATTQQNSGGAVAGVTAGKNAIINGSMDIWQRGTSVAYGVNGVGYSVDRWYVRNTGSSTVTSRQATGDTTNLPNIQYCARYSRDSGSTNTAPLYFTQNIETANSIPYAGKTVTYSFYARKGANFSGTIAAQVFSGTGTDQNLINGYTGQSQLLNSPIHSTLTTTWQRFTFTFAVGATATELAVHFDWTPSGTAGAADYLEVTGFQLEVGNVATPFSRAGSTIQGELAACQRYYWRFQRDAANFNLMSSSGYASTTAIARFGLMLPSAMRTMPTSIEQANIAANRASTDVRYTSGTWAIAGTGGANASNSVVEVAYTHGSGVFTQGEVVNIQSTNASNQYIGLSAEL